MSQRAVCRCPLCQMERHIIVRLEQEDSSPWFRGLTGRIATLREFSTMSDLIFYAHSAGRDPDKRRVCDGIYIALLRELSAGENADLLHCRLLRMLAPGLHRELRGMMVVSFPGIDKSDLTQQLITNCFETVRSPGILKKNAYIAASLIEWTKRDTYRWAIRRYRATDNEETRIFIDDVFKSPDSEHFESEVHLRELLEKALAAKHISADDVKLLTAYEIEGVSGEELVQRAGLNPKALSHRVRRAIQRLNRAFQKVMHFFRGRMMLGIYT
jgi:DNA-directed RNA polymerase specialized sigma24 family protein